MINWLHCSVIQVSVITFPFQGQNGICWELWALLENKSWVYWAFGVYRTFIGTYRKLIFKRAYLLLGKICSIAITHYNRLYLSFSTIIKRYYEILGLQWSACIYTVVQSIMTPKQYQGSTFSILWKTFWKTHHNGKILFLC